MNIKVEGLDAYEIEAWLERLGSPPIEKVASEASEQQLRDGY
jgi:hypothetical protein